MSDNPYMDGQEDGMPVFEGPDEDDISSEDMPVPRLTWLCTGVALKTLARKGAEPHTMPQGSAPIGGTTDASGSLVVGRCHECSDNTIWKKVTL